MLRVLYCCLSPLTHRGNVRPKHGSSGAEPTNNNGKRLHLNGDGQPVISEGLEAETARLLGGLPHRHEIPRALQVKRHALHHLEGATQPLTAWS